MPLRVNSNAIRRTLNLKVTVVRNITYRYKIYKITRHNFNLSSPRLQDYSDIRRVIISDA